MADSATLVVDLDLFSNVMPVLDPEVRTTLHHQFVAVLAKRDENLHASCGARENHWGYGGLRSSGITLFGFLGDVFCR